MGGMSMIATQVQNSDLKTKLFANPKIKRGYRPYANFVEESDRVFLTFSVCSQQVCDLQPGWFL